MSASTGDVLYDRPFSFPPASIAFCRGRAKRDPSVGVFWSKSASFRQFQWRGESLGEARSAVGFVGNLPLCPRQRTHLKCTDLTLPIDTSRGNDGFDKRIVLNRRFPHVGKQYLVQSIYTSCLPMVKFASVCEFDGCLHLAT